MNRTTGIVLVFFAAVGFGTIGIFGKLATAAGLNNPTFLSIRFALATTIMVGYLSVTGNTARPGRQEATSMFGLGLAYAVLTGAYFWGLLLVPAGLATITLYTYPIYVYVVAAVFLDEPLSRLKVVALALAIAGIAVIVGLDTTGADPLGLALVSVAAMAYAAYTTGSRLAVESLSADRLATAAMATTGASMLLYGLASGSLFVPSELDQWAIILGITIFGTVLPILMFVNGLRFVEASRASVVTTVEPVTTVVLGVLVLDEVLSPGILLGGTLVLAGVLLVQSERSAGRPSPRPVDE